MRIGIDARTFNKKNTGMGVERLLRNLLDNWIDLYPGHEFLLISNQEIGISQKLLSAKNIRKIMYPGLKSGLLWENVSLPKVLRENKVDVLFSPAYTTPLFAVGIPKVVVIHDISYRTIKAEYALKQRIVLDMLSFLSCVFADKVVTVSDYSKLEIEKCYKPKNGKIISIYHGLEKSFSPLKEAAPAKTGEYFLYVGTMFKRRHVKELLDAYDSLPGIDNMPGLVLVGANKIYPEYDIDRHIQRINSKMGARKITHHDLVDEEMLLSLYRNCLAFYYLSSYEGFGFPPLEAMACGAPVVTVNGSSITEVAGDAAIFVDPENIKDIRDSMSLMIKDQKLRDRMKASGIKRAALFDWGKSAVEYMKVLEGVVRK